MNFSNYHCIYNHFFPQYNLNFFYSNDNNFSSLKLTTFLNSNSKNDIHLFSSNENPSLIKAPLKKISKSFGFVSDATPGDAIENKQTVLSEIDKVLGVKVKYYFYKENSNNNDNNKYFLK